MRRLLLSAVVFFLGSVAAQAEPVIIKCARPCTAVVQAIESRGGIVTYRYRYVDAIAAEVNDDALRAVRALVQPGSVRKDVIVSVPSIDASRRDPAGALEVEAESAGLLSDGDIATLAATNPNAYLVNNASLNLGALHGAAKLGQGMKVAVIDSGIRPGFPHISLDGSVIGGEDFVSDGLGYSNSANNGHGTFVAGMISSNVTFTFAAASGIRNAVLLHCPSCVTGATSTQIPMIGSAPLSSIYALRVFAPTGGAPESRIMAAMERVLELRENYDTGQPEVVDAAGKYSALNITVCNMSLGGPTLYAGRDLQDQLTQAFLDKDIVLVVSAGNAGPGGATGGAPGTGFGALTVGASSSPVHERILRSLQFGLGIGALYRPFNATQMAYFSSRGPTADGRIDPDVVANGFASYGQGLGTGPTSISIASGTSFSAPTVSGVAAVLRQSNPTASARQVRNALIMSANPGALADGSGPLDRGAGHVNAAAGDALLQAWTAPDTAGVVGGTNRNVNVNILQGAGVETFTDVVTRSVAGLKPGQRFETFYKVTANTSAVVVTVSGVTPGSPQNVLFGDDILLTVHSAKTSSIGEGDYKVFTFTTGGTFTIPNPDLGLMRITLNGDWTNASPIGATVTISPVKLSTPQQTAQSDIQDGDVKQYKFIVPPGTAKLEARLEWSGDWANYPTNDLDLVLFPPTGPANVGGATLNSPEIVSINNPVAGEWTAVVVGFTVPTTGGDRFSLRIATDGTAGK